MKKLLAILLAMVVLLSLVACAAQNDAQTDAPAADVPQAEEPAADTSTVGAKVEEEIKEGAKYKEHIDMSVWSALKSVDPLIQTGAAIPMYNMYLNQLVDLDEVNNVFRPELAESWELVDLQTYKFTLKKGIQFHNGEELKASDVKFSFVDRPTTLDGVTATFFQKIDNIEIVDDYNFIIHLNAPDPEYLYSLAEVKAAIFNQKACEASDEGYLVGTGGYKVNSWSVTDKMELEKFDASWVWAEEGDTPTRTITMKCMSEGSIPAVQAGDIANALCEREDAEGYLLADPNVDCYGFYTWNIWYIGLNQHEGSVFHDDHNLQKAVVAAFDRNMMAEFYAGEYAKVPDSFFPDFMFGYTNEYEFAKYDLDAAQKYLAASNYPDGNVTIRALCLTNANYTAQITVLQSMLEANLGIKLDITQLDSAGRTAALAEGTSYDLYLFDDEAATYGSRQSYRANPKDTFNNSAHYVNDEVVQLYADYLSTTDETVQKEKLARVQEIFAEDLVYVPYAYQYCWVVTAKGVSGLDWRPSTAFDFHRVVWEES